MDERKPIVRRVERKVDWKQAGLSVLDVIAPEAMELRHRDHLISGRMYIRGLAVVGFPSTVRFGYLTRLFTGQRGVHVMQAVLPLDEGESRRFLGRTRRTARVTLLDTEDAAQVEAGLQDIERLRLRVARGQERLIRYGIYIMVSAPSREELEERTAAVEAQCNALGLHTIRCSFRQKQIFDAFVPAGIDPLEVYSLVDTSTVARGFFAVSSSIIATEGKPVFYGLAVERGGNTGGPVLFDPFSPNLSNPHAAVLATSGAGKSYLLKYELLHSMLYGRRYFVIDPEHEYEHLASRLGGSFIRIAPGSAARINPLDLPRLAENVSGDEEERDPLMEKISALSGWLEAVLSPHRALAPSERGKLEEAVAETYRSREITSDPKTHSFPPPTLADLLPRLESRLPELSPALERLCRGPLAMFNGETNVDMSAPLVVFGFRDTGEELKGVAALLVFDHIWTQARSRPDYVADPLTVLLDEAWTLIQSTTGGQMLAATVRRGRKYNLRLVIATQQVEDVVSSPIGRTVINNCHTVFLLQLKPTEIPLARDAFKLSPGEVEFLEGCERTERYSDCLLSLGKRRIGLRVLRAPESVHRLITSLPTAV